MLSQERADDLVKRIVAAVRPHRILLFGSAADDSVATPNDIDVLVVVGDGAHRRRTAQCIYRNLGGFGISVDVVVATESDINRYKDSPGLVYREAVGSGKVLYAA